MEKVELAFKNEERMSIDHSTDGNYVSGVCDSLAANYYIHTGKWAQWGDENYYGNESYHVHPFCEKLAREIDDGQPSCSITAEAIWRNKPDGSGMEGRWVNNRKIILEKAFTDTKADTLMIPAGAVTIRSQAFANSSITTVYAPDGVKRATDSFKDCNRILFVTTDEDIIAYARENHGLVANPSDNGSKHGLPVKPERL